MNALLTKYAADIYGDAPVFTLDSPKYSTEMPMLFEPGEGWEYGISLEWVGKMVERVNGNVKLGKYMEENIFDVLGMDLTSFKPWDNPDMMRKMGGRAWRDPATGKVTIDETGWFSFSEHPEDDYGGGGAFSCAQDYIKVLMSLLLNDGKLLKPETVELLFTPQLEDPTYLRRELSTGPISVAATNGLPKDSPFNYGLGGCMVMGNVPGHCRRGLLFWSGLPNSFWVRIAFHSDSVARKITY